MFLVKRRLAKPVKKAKKMLNVKKMYVYKSEYRLISPIIKFTPLLRGCTDDMGIGVSGVIARRFCRF